MSPTAIHFENVSHAYEEDTPAIRGVSLDIAAGALTCIIGQNGSGKTTLIKHINGLLRPNSGSLSVLGTDTRERSVAQMAQRVSFCFQNPDHQLSQPTVREEISFGPHNLGLDETTIAEYTNDVMAELGLESWSEMPPTMLSLGLRKLVCIAAAMAMNPDIMVLDEPTVGLDHGTAQRVFAVINTMRQRGCTVVCVTHDMNLVAAQATQTVVMQAGSILIDGPTAQVLADADTLRQAHVTPPQTVRLAQALYLAGDMLSVEGFCAAYAADHAEEVQA